MALEGSGDSHQNGVKENGANGINGHDTEKKANGQSAKVRELKLVVMSATLDPSKFVNFFDT